MLKLTQRDNMKFNELREANLSKAQINKVHDKADDLPKSDFIKRYGKEGDAVRFATATNIVKKQLGIGEGRIMGISRLNPSYKEGEKAAQKGIKYDKNPYSQSTPGFKRLNWSSGHNAFRATQLSKAGKPNYGARGQFEELDKEDEKSIGDVIKGLKKAVKAHQGQVDALTKDIKDEVEVTEARAKMPSDNNIKKKHGNATPMKSYKQGFDAANKGKKITTNPHKSMFGFDRSAWNKGFTDADQGFNIKTFSQNDYDDKGVMKKEEVEITEAVSAALVNQIKRMTDRNNHFGVRIELARIAGDKELMQHYASLEKMHSKLGGVIGDSALVVRQKLESVLKNRLQRKFNDKDADRLMGAL